MTRNPLQFCHIALEPRGWREQKVLDLGVGTRRVLYGPAIKPRIEIQAENVEIELNEHNGQILAALRLSDSTRFVTVGDDHRILIRNIQGTVEGVLSGHVARIGGVWELTGNRLATWGEDNSLFVWNTRGRGTEITHIRTKIRSPDRVFVAAAGDFFCLTEGWKARMVAAANGKVLTVLKPQIETVTGARRLTSGWITQSKRTMKRWSDDGRLQRKFLRSFSLDDGYFDLPDGQLVVVDDQHYIDLFDREGVKVATRAADAVVAGALRRFLRSRTSAQDANAARPTFEQFEHRGSPISEPKLLNGAPKAKQLACARAFWDFFHRPDIQSIRTWRRDEVQTALDAREHVAAAISTHRMLGTRAETLSLVGCFLFGMAAMTLFQSRQPLTITLSLAGVLATSFLAIHFALKVFDMRSAEKALTVLTSETDAFVSKLRAHRRRLLASLPFMRSSELYVGGEARHEIERMIAGPLRDTALVACGLRPTDIDNQDWKPITLVDWALPRQAQAVADDQVISPNNLDSFWWTPDGAFVFAVQSIQYILPIHDKVDVYTVDYDFIERRAFNQTVHTFHYADVTHLTVRNVSRAISFPGVAANVGATEITLVLRNGKSIALTVLDERSAVPLRKAAKIATGASLDEQRQILQDELQKWKTQHDPTDGLRAMEIRSLGAQLAALEAESVSKEDVADPTRSRPDEVVAYLRSLFLDHKVASPKRAARNIWDEHPEA